MTLRARRRDALGTAVLASLVLHVVLLGVLPGWHDTQRLPAPAPILARVVREPPFSERAVPRPQTPPLPEKPSPPKRAGPQREAVGAPVANAPEPVQNSSRTAAEPLASGAVATETAPRPEPVSTHPVAATADTGTLAQYRLAIISLARGFNRYPRIAVENNWQGRVEVRVTVGADGAIASLGLRSGSGHEILDRQALDMIGGAARKVSLPVSLRGREFVLDIPVIFSLGDAER